MSQGPMSTSPSKGGRMPSQQTSYQSPFGNQNYRTQTAPGSKGGSPSYGGQQFGGPAYQQPGQFGGQIMNRQPVGIPPMPSPGGKGGSYNPPPMQPGYGQPTFAPQQFGGYGQPSNIFSFNNPHYQPYQPQPMPQQGQQQPPQQGQQQPPQQGQQQPAQTDPSVDMRQQVRDLGQEGIRSGAVTRDMLVQAGYSNPDEIISGAGGAQQPATQQYSTTNLPSPQGSQGSTSGVPMPNLGGKGGSGGDFRVFDPYGEGGAYYGQERPIFFDPTQPQGPQGTVQNPPMSIPNLGGKGGNFRSQLPMQTPPRQDMQPERDPTMPTTDRSREEVLAQRIEEAARPYRFDPQMVSEFSRDPSMVSPALSGSSLIDQYGLGQPMSGPQGSGIAGLFNVGNLAQKMRSQIPGPPTSGYTGGYDAAVAYSRQLAQQQGSGSADLFNAGNLGQQMRSQIPGPPTGADSVFNNPRYKDLQMQQQRLSMAGRDRPEVKAQLQNLGAQLQNMLNNSNDAAYTRQLERNQSQQRATSAFASNPRLRYTR